MKSSILILDTVGENLKAGLFDRGKLKTLCLRGADNSGETLLFKALDRLLLGAKLNLSDLKALVVSSGPGRFTGIRIGMTFAAVVEAQARVSALAISSLEALAFGTEGKNPCPVLSGYRGERYYQPFRRKALDLTPKPVSDPSWVLAENWAWKKNDLKADFDLVEREAQPADFLKAALFYLSQNQIPKFEPLYLKAAGYERK